MRAQFSHPRKFLIHDVMFQYWQNQSQSVTFRWTS